MASYRRLLDGDYSYEAPESRLLELGECRTTAVTAATVVRDISSDSR